MTHPAWAPDFDAWAHPKMAVTDAPGLAAAFARDGSEVYARGYGERDVDRNLPVTPDTVFGVASVTKSFTAVAIMQLQEAGKLSVHDPVTRYLPELRTPDPEHTRAVTIHHFLTHSSGLPPLPSRWFAFVRDLTPADLAWLAPHLAEYIPHPFPAHTPIDSSEALMDFIAACPFRLLGPPGARFSYGNEGFALLGAIVERVSGRPYPDYVQAHILAPTGMTRSTFDVDTALALGDTARPYAAVTEDGGRRIAPVEPWMRSRVWDPAGGLFSTTRDLLHYLEVYRTGGTVHGERLLSEASVQQMTAPHIVQHRPGASYGYGLGVHTDFHGATLIEHGGGRRSIAADVAAIPQRGITAAVLCNMAETPVEAVITGGLNALLGLPVATPRLTHGDHTCPPAQLAAYAGTYRSGEGGLLTVTTDTTSLLIAFERDGQPLPARPVAEHAFLVTPPKGEDRYLRFVPDGDAYALAFGSRLIHRRV